MRKRNNFRLSLEDDEESTTNEMEKIESGSDVEESAETKRRRLAKRYIQQLESTNQHFEDHEHTIPERLQRDRLLRSREYAIDCSAAVTAIDFSSIPYRQINSSGISCLALSTDALFAYVGSKDNSLNKLDCETGQRLKLKEKWRHGTTDASRSCELLSVAVSFDGKYAVSGGRDNLIRVFDCRLSCAEVQTLNGHKGAVSGLAFQDNSYSLFSSSFDGTIKNWNLNDMCYYETLFGHQVIE
jgi:ribosomal RNA-processing protein 9